MCRGFLKMNCVSDEAKALHHAKRNDDDHPCDGNNNRESVEVLLCNSRGACIGAYAATEHIGKTATLALVHKNEQRQQNAGNYHNGLQNNLKYGHLNLHL